jgi:hypothetical protein
MKEKRKRPGDQHTHLMGTRSCLLLALDRTSADLTNLHSSGKVDLGRVHEVYPGERSELVHFSFSGEDYGVVRPWLACGATTLDPKRGLSTEARMNSRCSSHDVANVCELVRGYH